MLEIDCVHTLKVFSAQIALSLWSEIVRQVVLKKWLLAAALWYIGTKCGHNFGHVSSPLAQPDLSRDEGHVTSTILL